MSLQPIRIQGEMRPRFNEESLGASSVAGLKADSFVLETSLENAEREWHRTSGEFKKRFENGSTEALKEILDLNPEYASEEWVRKACVEFLSKPCKRGRPRGITKLSRTVGLMIVIYVEFMVETKGKTLEAIFNDLAMRNFERIGYDRVKQLFYRLRHDSRLSPHLTRRGVAWEVDPSEVLHIDGVRDAMHEFETNDVPESEDSNVMGWLPTGFFFEISGSNQKVVKVEEESRSINVVIAPPKG